LGVLEEAGDQGKRGPVQASVAGDGVCPQLDIWSREGKYAHLRPGGVAKREQPDAQAGRDHVLHQIEAVRLVGDAGREPGHGGERADDVLVRGVAGVADPVVGPVAGEDLQCRFAGHRFAAGYTQAPPRGPQRRAVHGWVDGGGGEVVVVDERQVGLVGHQQLQCFGGLVLAQQHADPGMSGGQGRDDRQQVCAERGTESGHTQDAVGFCLRSQVQLRGLHGGEDGHGMLGQPAPGRCQPDPAPGRLDQRRAHLAGEDGDLLRHGRGGCAENVRDRAHGAQPVQLCQQLQPSGLHARLSRI
jgi:hypothetical protein